MDDLYTQDTIRTFTGLQIDVFNPKPEMICIEDIAHGLSNTPRWGGQIKDFYPTAQHCVHVASLAIERKAKLEALMHDAAEAYLHDMPKPIKRRLPDYQELENNLTKAIFEKFNIPYPMSNEIKMLDKEVLELEFSVFFKNQKVGPDYLRFMLPSMAKNNFLSLFNALTTEDKSL